ncbi:MAG: tRNA guanosine(34) transglycosylase Tgt [Dehalococcoidia bacterium]|nr:tRNA guanosine(34) transglycosylase Tgt [Dehalococcoidia bacterium]
MAAGNRPPFHLLTTTRSRPRAGVLRTAHGEVPTPAFMAVATQGTVKALGVDDLGALGASIVLGNTYHLSLRPGVDVIRRHGGLHGFMGWAGPILTDSGGFQVYSLGLLRTVDDEGVTFKSHLDGSLHRLTPESAVAIQEALGSDVAMALDVCPPADASPGELRRASELTAAWAARCRAAHGGGAQALFGIVQGGTDLALRRESVGAITKLGFDGYAIGGLSVGERKAEMYETVASVAAMLPAERPRYLMGVGSPEDLVECVALGIDLFDCVLPTRMARNGGLYIPEGRLNIYNARFKEATGPIQEGCGCFTCRHHSAAYLHHLFQARELLAYRLATIHNLHFYLRLMERLRQSILDGTFEALRREFLATFKPPDEEVRREQKERWLALRRALARQA